MLYELFVILIGRFSVPPIRIEASFSGTRKVTEVTQNLKWFALRFKRGVGSQK